MKSKLVVTICIVALLTGSVAVAQQECDYLAVGANMESAAADGDWSAVYEHAAMIVDARPEDISALSAEEQYYVGLAHAYMMAQAFGMAADGLEGERAQMAAELSAKVLDPVENIRTVSHGERVNLEDYLVEGRTVLFDFTSEYCPPCVAIAPHLERLANERDDILLVKVDINRPGVQGIDWQSPVAQQHGIRGVPHFKIYGPDGELQSEGGPARDTVMNWLRELEG